MWSRAHRETQYAQPHAPPQENRGQYTASQQHNRTAYESGRAWEQLNPEVVRVANDPRLNYTQTQQGEQIHGQPSDQPGSAYAYSYHGAYTPSSDSYNSSSDRLTAQQLHAHNYGQPSVDRMSVWQSESQRDGCWYGNVEQRRP